MLSQVEVGPRVKSSLRRPAIVARELRFFPTATNSSRPGMWNWIGAGAIYDRRFCSRRWLTLPHTHVLSVQKKYVDTTNLIVPRGSGTSMICCRKRFTPVFPPKFVSGAADDRRKPGLFAFPKSFHLIKPTTKRIAQRLPRVLQTSKTEDSNSTYTGSGFSIEPGQSKRGVVQESVGAVKKDDEIVWVGSHDPTNPQNWPQHKQWAHIITVAIQALIT